MVEQINEEKDIDLMYYYCDAQTFLSIIKNRSIWLTNVEKMNDSSERESLYLTHYESIINLANQEHDNIGQWLEFERYIRDNGYWKAFDTDMLKAAPSTYVYAACFSEDSDSVSQWISYANDGKGFAIGFSKEKILELCGMCSSFHFNKINYLFPDYLKDSVNEIYKEANEIISNTSDEHYISNTIEFINREIKKKYKQDSIFYKKPHYQNEKEWKLTYKQIQPELKRDEGLQRAKFDIEHSSWNLDGFKYYAKSNCINSYIELNFPVEIFKEIIIGPRNINDIYEIIIFLESLGYKNGISVKSSTSNYRG